MSSYTIESSQLSHLLLHLQTGQINAILNDTNVSLEIKNALTGFINATVTVISKNRLYLLQDSNKDIKLEIIETESSGHNNSGLEIFTLQHKTYKDAVLNYQYRLTLLENTFFNQDIKPTEQQLQQAKDESKDQEIQLIHKINSQVEKWNKERSELYSKRKDLINQNKELYNDRQHLSKKFYNSDKETRSKKEHIEEYRKLLEQSEKNKNTILEINQMIELLDRKSSLYISETYSYNSTYVITISQLNKEEVSELVAKKGGKSIPSYKNKDKYDVDFLETLDEYPLQNQNQRYYYELKTNIKKLSKKNKTKSKTNRQVYQELQSK